MTGAICRPSLGTPRGRLSLWVDGCQTRTEDAAASVVPALSLASSTVHRCSEGPAIGSGARGVPSAGLLLSHQPVRASVGPGGVTSLGLSSPRSLASALIRTPRKEVHRATGWAASSRKPRLGRRLRVQTGPCFPERPSPGQTSGHRNSRASAHVPPSVSA